MTVARVVSLLLLLVTAGCAGPLVPDDVGPGPTVDDGATSSTASPSTQRDTPPASDTARPSSAENPWRSSEVVVAVDNRATPNRSFVPLVERAVAYWNGPGRANATYPATFRVVPDAADPDVVVVVREHVTCADRVDVLGCAPRLSADDRPPTPVEVEVAAGFSDETTLTTIEHEFGHLLGLEHGEPPLPLMESRHAAATLPRTDAVNKSNPWTTDHLRVYVDLSGAEGDPATLRDQVRHAVAYYDEGAEGHVPANVSFALVENRSRAQIVVVVDRDRADCPTGQPVSCGFREGYDPDRDGTMEYYTNGTIVVNGIDDEAVGWHAGYWLGVLMGHDQPEELAPPFRDASYAERRSDWWA